MRRPTAALLCIALIAATGAPAYASPGALGPEVAPGRHAIEHEAYVDIGTFSDCLTWHYVIREGDTLGEIAQRELGSVRRHREILALNPSVDPRRIRAGVTLEMPPRGNGCERGRDRYVFFAWTPASGAWSAPRRLADERIHRVGHGTCLFAVPIDRLAGVCAASGAQALCARALARDPRVARTDVLHLEETLPDDDPTQRLVTHYRVVGIRDGRIALARTSTARFDAEGRRIESVGDASSGGTTLLQILVFLLLVAGAGFVVARTQRRAAGLSVDPETLEDVVYEVQEGGDESYEGGDDEAYEEGDDEAYEEDDDA